MIINDINYLEATNEEVFGGWGNKVSKEAIATDKTNLKFTANFDVFAKFKKTSTISSHTDLEGNQATLAFVNNAIGDGSLVEAELSNNVVQDKGSFQSGLIVAAVDK
ncbi:MAG: hypothetical protein WBF90_06540 [Rivularia sp. (in: cyanobacteria)]